MAEHTDAIIDAVVTTATSSEIDRPEIVAAYAHLRNQLTELYGQPVASAITDLENEPTSPQARDRLATSLGQAGADAPDLVALAHAIAQQPGVSHRRRTARSAVNRRWIFPASITIMLAIFIAIAAHYGEIGFSDNADIFDILQLGLLPGIIAMIPIWLMFRHKSLRRAGHALYSLLLFTFVLVVSLGYIYQWPWAIHKLGETGQPATNLWDWLSVALLPFLVPVVTAVAAADPGPPGEHAATATPARNRRVGALLGLVPALLSVILVGVVVPAIYAAPAAASTDVSQPGDTGELVIDVPATASWTFTHIPVHKNDILTIAAAGTISFIPGGPLVGPDGDPAPHQPAVCVLPTCTHHHAALIGDIDGTAPSHPFLVGAHYSGTVDRDGTLVLGINDIGVDNNSGSYGALVDVRTGS